MRDRERVAAVYNSSFLSQPIMIPVDIYIHLLFFVLDRHLDGFQMRVHGHVDAGDSSMHLCTVQ